MPLHIKILSSQGESGEYDFSKGIIIGRSTDCDIALDESVVSRFHAEISFDGKWWWLKDLNSKNGTFLNGRPVSFERLPKRATVQLGIKGPVLEINTNEVEEEKSNVSNETVELGTETEIIRHFFEGKDENEKDVGEKTLMFRRAFKRAYKRKSRKYLFIVTACLILLTLSLGIIVYQKKRLEKLRIAATDIFYSMKILELEIGHLEDLISKKVATAENFELLKAKKQKLQQLEKSYQKFVEDLGVYRNLSPQERAILKVARIFGECEINVPKGFSKEVKRYISKWRSTGRLKKAMKRAISKGYDKIIIDIFTRTGVTPFFLFLCLQESNFNEKAIGPKTRYGYAKGAWQFIPATARQYGLRLGPLYKERVYDPYDERFNFILATRAAAHYIRDLYNTEAQASGLLVMAAYNWGHTKVRKIIRRMPPDPRERNFWKLMRYGSIPKETYDYVFYIFSAAVICEDPDIFGMDIDCGVITRLTLDNLSFGG